MARQQKIEKQDPAAALVTSLLSLYVTFPLTTDVSVKEAKDLSPADALTLSLMALKNAFRSTQIEMLLNLTYGVMNEAEAAKFVEVTLQNLVNRGFVKTANKEAQSLFEERFNEKVQTWGLPNIPFVITAAGAKRVGWLVGNLTSVQYDDVVKNLQVESKAAAAEWLVNVKKERASRKAASAKKAIAVKKNGAKKPAVAEAVVTKKLVKAKTPTVAKKLVSSKSASPKKAVAAKPVSTKKPAVTKKPAAMRAVK